MIHVAYGTSNLYSKFAATSMLSLFENTLAEITVHILHDNTLALENRDRFNYIAGHCNQQVKFYNVEELCAEKIAELKRNFANADGRFNITMFYRLFIPNVLDSEIDKIIYLDSDTIINLDIKELWQIELKDKALAVAAENYIDSYLFKTMAEENFLITSNLVEYNDYFNSGVMVMNLNYLRNSQALLNEGLQFRANNPQCRDWDQAVLNYCFSKSTVKIPAKFNSWVVAERVTKKIFKIRPAIYHYLNNSLEFNLTDVYNRLFFKYFIKTPFFNEEMLFNLSVGIQHLCIQQKNFARQVSEIMSGKTRAFFIQSQNIEVAKQIFHVRPDEEIIDADSPESLQTLINSLKNSNGQKVFFVLVLYQYFSVQEILIRAGFKEDKDFVNAEKFLSDAEGLPFDSYQFIKLL